MTPPAVGPMIDIPQVQRHLQLPIVPSAAGLSQLVLLANDELNGPAFYSSIIPARLEDNQQIHVAIGNEIFATKITKLFTAGNSGNSRNSRNQENSENDGNNQTMPETDPDPTSVETSKTSSESGDEMGTKTRSTPAEPSKSAFNSSVFSIPRIRSQSLTPPGIGFGRQKLYLTGAANSISSNIEEIKEFAREFKRRRLSLGLTQTQVGQALSNIDGPSYSQSAICRYV